MSNPKFSILTGCYNSGKYLSDWGKSILQQSYRPLEAVLSIEKYHKEGDKILTRSFIEKYSKKFIDHGIEFKVIENKQRLFCASCYEVARRNATGTFFGILDSDDMLTPESVVYIMSLYNRYPDIGYIYTQFEICNKNSMKKIRRGFSQHPGKYKTILNGNRHNKHVYSHWRTYSSRIKNPEKLFKPGLKCAVDKYMGYVLEEQSPGAFVDKVCYRYRFRPAYSISSSEPTVAIRKKLIISRVKHRKKNAIKAKPIMLL